RAQGPARSRRKGGSRRPGGVAWAGLAPAAGARTAAPPEDSSAARQRPPRRHALLLRAHRCGRTHEVRDYRGAGTPRATLLLHEKNGKEHVVPAHHVAAEYLDAYL